MTSQNSKATQETKAEGLDKGDEQFHPSDLESEDEAVREAATAYYQQQTTERANAYNAAHPPVSATPFNDQLAAQGDLQPGEEGYWQVWGARVGDIKPGDLVMLKYSDAPEPSEYQVAEAAPRGDGHLMDTVRPRFLATSGELFTVGALQPIVVLRKGTRHTLAESI